ncbi:MAG: T9SS type A sorting domain-containing protein, partial [Flavobacteriaceae bacterium]|nr:T9SS type A sorting domain-containing protein [Flavobacteriaceae bacterium]
YNNITALDISSNQLLNRLDAEYNAGLLITTDTVIGNATLNSLNLSGTGLSNYNLYSGFFPNLEWLLLNDNLLDRFNANNALNVKNLFLNNNVIDKLDLSANVALLQLYVANNVLTELDLRNGNNLNITNVDVTNNLLTCISVDNPDDTSIFYSSWLIDSGVTLSLDCRAEPEVVLIPDTNFEAALGINNDTNGLNGNILLSDALNIINLDVSDKNIIDLTGIEAFENLISLDVSNNELTSIVFTTADYNGPTNLTYLNVSGNLLSELVVVSGRSLEILIANDNNLSSINFQDITDISDLNLSNNNFINLDLSAFDLLQQLDVSANPFLEELNLISGNNLALIEMDALDNPNLFCIGVDDPVQAEANSLWYTDSETIFNNSGDCEAPNVVTLDIEVPLDRNGLASILPADIDGGSTDNVSSGNKLVFSIEIEDFNCSNLGVNVVELSVTDEAGNTGIGYANVTIVDNELPVVETIRIRDPFDLEGGNLTLDPLTFDDGSSDNCGIASFTLSQSYFTLPGTYFVDLIVADSSGNEASESVEIEVIDSSVGSEELRFGNTTVIIYPNPFIDDISLNFSQVIDFGTVSASLTDFAGNPINTSFVVQDSQNLKATGLSYLMPGQYILSLTVGNRTRTAILIHL